MRSHREHSVVAYGGAWVNMPSVCTSNSIRPYRLAAHWRFCPPMQPSLRRKNCTMRKQVFLCNLPQVACLNYETTITVKGSDFMSFKVEVWGDYACFTRPEMKVERVSYDVMTPSAARGLLEAIYWHPGMKWIVDRIFVCAPIRFTNIRRNEVKSKINASTAKSAMLKGQGELYLNTKDDIQQRAAMLLKNVHYVIEAHFEMTDKASPTDNQGKFTSIILRRLERGQCYHQPCFGCREYPAHFRAWEGGTVPVAGELKDESRDLGFMLYDLDYSDPQNILPMFFRARLDHGVLDLTDCEVLS